MLSQAIYRSLVLSILLVLIVTKSYAICDFTVSSTNVCAGDIVTITLKEPLKNYHRVIIFRGDYPVGTTATGADYVLVRPYSLTDKEIKIQFRGRNIAQDFSILLAEDDNNSNPNVPCNKKVLVTVNPSPDPEISGTLSYCNATTTTAVTIRNASSTSNNNVSYTINWGDGTPNTTTSTFDSLTHNYNPGYYEVEVTVNSSFPAPCNSASKKFGVTIGSQSPFFGFGSAPSLICAPVLANIQFDSQILNNTPDTYYKVYVDGELQDTYNQTNIPISFNYYFEEGSCGKQGCGGQQDRYKIEVTVGSDCSVPNTYCSPQPIRDSVFPWIQAPDTVCTNVPTTAKNGNESKDKVFNLTSGKCEKAPMNWQVTPTTGWVSANPNLNNSNFTAADLNITYTQPGTYQIKLTVQGDCDQKDSIKTIIVEDPVVISADYIPVTCITAPPGYVDIPFTSQIISGIPRSYTWSVVGGSGTATFVGGTNNKSKDVIIRFTRGANYTVSLVALGACPSTPWSTSFILRSAPIIDTNAIPTICSTPYTFNNNNGTPVFTLDDHFTFDEGNDNTTSYLWDFPSGTPSSANTDTSGNIVFNDVGTYTIKVTLTNSCGVDSASLPITLFNNPKPVAGPDFSVCINSDAYMLSGWSPTGGVWSGTGITDATNGIFNANGIDTGRYNLIYTTFQTTVCPVRDTAIVTVIDIIGLTAGPPQSICKGKGYLQLTPDPNFTGGNWFGTGIVNNSLGLFDPTGLVPDTFLVGYIFQDPSGSCIDTAYKEVIVYDSLHFNPPPNLCVGISYNFVQIIDNLNTAQWDFGDGSSSSLTQPTHAYTTSGIKNVSLTGTTVDGCLYTLNFQITVIGLPDLSFNISPDSTCTGQNILFSFPSNHDTAQSYFWDFSNGQVSTLVPDPQVRNFNKPIYSDTFYTITLRATYECGVQPATKQLKVKASPKAGFSIEPLGCSPFNPILLNQSYGSPTSYTWTFGNGQIASIPNPTSPTYTNPTRNDSVFTVMQRVSNVCGMDSIKKDIIVRGNQTTANLTQDITEGCQPLNVTFNSISSTSNVVWNFGDGQEAYGEQTIHTFENAGVYTVKLLVIGNGNCGRDSVTSTVRVYPKPTVDFNVTNQCIGTATRFISVTANTSTYQWSFGDGNSSSQKNPSNTYVNVGNYDVKLIAYSNRGCVDSVSKNISISVQPEANFVVQNNNACLDEPIIFINTSSGGTSYSWSLGDGTIFNGSVPTNYIYQTAGTYTVSLTAINGECRDSIIKPNAVTLFPTPIADFSFLIDPDLNFKAPVVFTNLSSFADNFVWALGDGDSSSSRDLTHQYDGTGPYRVILYASNSEGCTDSIGKLLLGDFDGAVYVPNVFAPEVAVGDAALFKPKGVDMKEYHAQVFSTYGQLLWESKELIDGQPSEGWDGTYNGQLMPQDIYIWKIRAIFNSGRAWEGMLDERTQRKTTMGSILLLR